MAEETDKTPEWIKDSAREEARYWRIGINREIPGLPVSTLKAGEEKVRLWLEIQMKAAELMHKNKQKAIIESMKETSKQFDNLLKGDE